MSVLIDTLLIVGLISFLIVLDVCRIRRLPALVPASESSVEASPVSIIIPARNEAENIARCLDGALAQRYPNYEVIVVDDGSTDATPHILAEYIVRFPDRFRVTRGRPLPPRWVGKCNACLHGAEQASAGEKRGDHEWLLFLDADTVPQPTLLGSLITYAQERRLDVVTAMPFNELPTLAEKLVIPVFYQFALTAFPVKRLLDPDMPPNNAMANGQCLMVRSEAYWSVGGHAAVKDKVLEDIEFAQALRRAGYRLGLATAFDQMRVRMYHNFGEIVQGLGKHASAGRRASGWRGFWSVLRLSLTSLAPLLLLLFCLIHVLAHPANLYFWLASAVAAFGYASSLEFWRTRYHTWYRLPGWLALLTPIGWLIYLYIVVRGTFQVLFKRGVKWKERVYSS